jgi:hypothetical protein
MRRFGAGGETGRWRRSLRYAARLPASTLREIAAGARGAGAEAGAVAAEAEAHLLDRLGAAVPVVPDAGCDWAARPELWRTRMTPRGIAALPSPTRLPGGVSLFHDGHEDALGLRQDPDPLSTRGGAPFGLVLEIYGFDGSFVSLVHDLPPEALAGLGRDHYIAVRLTVERERPVEIFARLNVRHGPNLEQMVRQVDLRQSPGLAEFDLACTGIDDRRVEGAWLDLIVESPAMTRIAFRDMVVLRALRAHV